MNNLIEDLNQNNESKQRYFNFLKSSGLVIETLSFDEWLKNEIN